MSSRARVLVSIAASACLTFSSFPAFAHASTTPAVGDPSDAGLVSGVPAIEALGTDLASVAADYGLSSQELREHLAEDPALRVDPDNRLLFVDEMLTSTDAPSMLEPMAGWAYAGQDYTASDAFALHSRPTAPVRVYLDFDGHTTTGTYWNNSYGTTMVSAPLDYDSAPTTFSAAERTVIGKVWSGVAEDFAAFNIDVTTEAPSVEDLRKIDAGDTRYGIRVVITPTSFMAAGGVAYLNSFSWDTDTPAFCFGANYAYDQMILVISHEVGHTFGLQHDGTASAGYYSGHGNWGPIMGAPYGKAVAQWSKGEYAGANNTSQDDVALIAAVAPYVADDFSDTMAGARTIEALSTPGAIGTAADADWFKFSFPSGALRVQLTPAFNPNLDAAVEIWRSGALVSRLDPSTLAIDTILESLPADEYFIKVEGTGYLDKATTGYSDYGSIGEYVLTFTGNVSTDPPATIAVASSKSYALAGADVAFSVSSSSHPTLAGVALTWSFSDGTTATGATVTKVMPNTATLTATVTATTDNGGVTVKTSSVRLSRAPTVTASATPAITKANVNVMFSASGSDPDSQALQYAWAFSDGTTASGASAVKTKASVGVLTGVVTLTDADGNTASSTTTVDFVANLVPVVTANATPLVVAVPATVTFSGSAIDPEATAVTYKWVFSDGTTATTARAVKSIATAGTFTGTLTATDANGMSASKVVNITANANGSPVISSATVSAPTMASPASLFFTAVANDPNMHPMSYKWDFSDGTTMTGARVAKTVTAPGTYSTTVTVTDSGGLSVSKVVAFTVTANQAPTVAVTATTGLTLVSPATFGLRATGTDPDKQAMTYKWVFSDGTTATTASVTKKFTTPGTYTAVVTVKDLGGLTGSATVTLTVSPNTAPTVTATTSASTLVAPALFALKAVGADVNNQVMTYKWAFSDGTTATTAAVSKKFTTAGTHYAVVTVTDVGGLTATKTLTLTVTPNTAPTVTASAASLTLAAPASFALTATGADADNQTLAYRWAFSDNTSSSAALVSKKFLTAGTYTAVVTVTDTGGLTATKSLTLTVTANVAPTISNAQVSASTAAASTSRTFSALAADADNQALAYRWVFGDGTSAAGASISKAFSAKGTFSAVVTVTDPGGLTASRNVSYTVS